MLSKETLAKAQEAIERNKGYRAWFLTSGQSTALKNVVEAAEAAQKDDFVFRVAVEYDVVVTLKDPPQTDGRNACRDMILAEPRPVRAVAEVGKGLPCSVDIGATHYVGELPVNDQFSITVRRMQKDAYANAKDHGFHGENEVDFGTAIALIHSEASEALEAHRKLEPFIAAEIDEFRKAGIGDGERPYDEILRFAKRRQKEAIASELADVLIRCGDTAQMIGADLDKAVRDKMAFNKGRPFKHGGKAY